MRTRKYLPCLCLWTLAVSAQVSKTLLKTRQKLFSSQNETCSIFYIRLPVNTRNLMLFKIYISFRFFLNNFRGTDSQDLSLKQSCNVFAFSFSTKFFKTHFLWENFAHFFSWLRVSCNYFQIFECVQDHKQVRVVYKSPHFQKSFGNYFLGWGIV